MGKKRIKPLDSSKPAEAKKKPGARLTDMGQKALADMEKIQQKEKELEQEIAKKANGGAQEEIKLKAKSSKLKAQKVRSQRYQNIKKNIANDKKYSLSEAVELVLKNTGTKFDESVEVHLNTTGKISGAVSLPFATAKKQRVAIADDKLIESVSRGKIDFDVLIASPAMMPKLAKVAKILGPKGLMPNPKTGTITDKPEELKKKLESSRLAGFKTEAKAPLIHFTLGKVSIGREKLLANLKAFFDAVKKTNILKAVLCSSMGPGVKLDLEKI